MSVFKKITRLVGRLVPVFFRGNLQGDLSREIDYTPPVADPRKHAPAIAKRPTELISLCRKFDLAINECSVSNLKCNVFNAFYRVDVVSIVLCLLWFRVHL